MAGRKRGGTKTGGRAPGTPNRARREDKVALEDLAKTHAPQALAALVKIATKGTSEAAVVSAATALLDRGYGKPRQAMDIGGPGGLPLEAPTFFLTPIAPQK